MARPRGTTIDICGLTQLLVPAFLVAFAVSSVTGSDPIGWVAAVVTMAALTIVQRVRGTTKTCAIDHERANEATR